MILTTYDHPEANGRTRQPGEREYFCLFTLEDGSLVTVRMGEPGWEEVTNSIIDILSEAPSNDDGSLDVNS
jgi:hypothetical protein